MTSERPFTPICFIAVLALAGCAPFERGERRVVPDAAAVNGGGDAGALDAAAGGLSFATDVHPILLDRCGTCHREGGPGSSTRYVLEDDATADRESVLGLVDTDDAEASRLLVKARGEMHVGGSVLPRDSADYALVRAWIGAGAPP